MADPRFRLLALVGASSLVVGGAYLLRLDSRFGALFFCLLLAFSICCLVPSSGRILQNILTLLAAILVGFSLVEAAVSLTADASRVEIEPNNYSRETALGRAPARPGVMRERKYSADGSLVYDSTVTIDQHLTRKVDSATSGPTVAFFGDSFTFGIGLQDQETIPQVFSDLTNRRFRVFNFAGSGYSPSQFLRAMELNAYDDLIKRDPRLVVFLTFPAHAFRTACKVPWVWHSPRYELIDGSPVYQGPCASRFSIFTRMAVRVLGSTATYRKLVGTREERVTARDMDLFVAELIRAGQLVREKYGVPTLILFLPYDIEAERSVGPLPDSAALMAKLRQGGLFVLDAQMYLRGFAHDELYIPGDGHPRLAATRIWAKQVADFLATSSR